MSRSAALGCVWIFLVLAAALIPYPRHRPDAIALLVLFPVLLVLIAMAYGLVWALVFFAGAVSIYRYPARYLVPMAVQRLKGTR